MLKKLTAFIWMNKSYLLASAACFVVDCTDSTAVELVINLNSLYLCETRLSNNNQCGCRTPAFLTKAEINLVIMR